VKTIESAGLDHDYELERHPNIALSSMLNISSDSVITRVYIISKFLKIAGEGGHYFNHLVAVSSSRLTACGSLLSSFGTITPKITIASALSLGQML
jgi:hypothetical protein